MATTAATNTHNWTSGPVLPLSANRAYFQFLTHVTKSRRAGVDWPVDAFTEFGTGTTLGVCICALFSGAKSYQGFDLIRHVNLDDQHSVVDDIHSLFASNAPARNDNGEIAFEFPREIITDAILKETLSDSFVRSLKNDLSLLAQGLRPSRISYTAPYAESLPRYEGTSNYVMSTATLEHIDDLPRLYSQFRDLLRPGGVMSHSIDMRSHGYLKPWNGEKLWNGHWLLTDDEWESVTAGQEFSINRAPASQHLKLIVENGFELLFVQKRMFANKLKWSDLAPRHQWMTVEDIECSGLHVIARKL